MIFMLIAGTVTPFLVLVVDGPFADGAFIAIWLAAIAGIIIETVWVDSPKWVSSIVYSRSALSARSRSPRSSLKPVSSRAFWSRRRHPLLAGAIVYAPEPPEPSPAVFGYHEIFHVLVVAAAAAHFAAVAVYAGAAG